MEELVLIKVLVISFWFAILLILERIWPIVERPIFEGRQLKNITFWVINTVLSPLIILPLAYWGQTHHFWVRELHPYWIFIDLIILDLTLYWWHRALHEIPFLWRFHLVHHLDHHLDTTTAVRFHFGEVFLSTLVRLVVIVICAIPFTSVVLFEIAVLCASLFHHSNLRLPGFLAKALRPVVITPDVHWMHHHPPYQDTNSNYGTFLTLWDRLFMSWNGKYRYHNMPLGVEGLKEQNLVRLIIRPFGRQK